MNKEERYAIWNRYYQKHKTEINARRKTVRENYKNKLSKAENKIAELEAKLKHAEENCINKTCVVFKDKEDCVAKLLELEKENAELKEKNNSLTKKCVCLTNCNDSLQDLLSDDIKTLEQLTKAKEIIKKIEKIFYSGENAIRRLSKISDIFEEAEQFLNSEVEK